MKKIKMTAIVSLLALFVAVATTGTAMAQSEGEATASAAPSGLTATYADGQLTLTWTKGTDATYLKQFIENRVAGATPADWWITVAPTDMESFTLPAEMTVAGTTYDFRVSGAKLVNGVVTSVASSNVVTFAIPKASGAPAPQQAEPAPQPEATDTPTPEPAPPAAAPASPAQRKPSGLSATVSNGVVTLSWTPGTDARIVKQVVKRREPRKGWTNVDLGVSATTYTDTTVQSGKRYIYRIQGQRSNGRGTISNVARIRVP